MEIMEDPYPGATPEEHDRMLTEVRALIASFPNIPLELKSELNKRAGAFLEVKQSKANEGRRALLWWATRVVQLGNKE
jgi:hypothetical protein